MQRNVGVMPTPENCQRTSGAHIDVSAAMSPLPNAAPSVGVGGARVLQVRATDGNIVVPANNPWNPFGERFWSPTGAPNTDGSARLTGTPAAVRITNKRLTDLADAERQLRDLRAVCV